jgi:hypothetical protein
MKPKLTFLLALTFLFLFSGSVFGGVFDKEDEKVGILCLQVGYFSIDIKEKTVKVFSINKDKKLTETHKIIKETGIYIMSENKTKTRQYFIDRHTYEDKRIIWINLVTQDEEGNTDKDFHIKCIVGDKKF